MGLLTPEQVEKFEPLLKVLEEKEPIISAWRCNYFIDEWSFKEKIKIIISILKGLLNLNLKRVLIPSKGQIVIILIRDTPSTFGYLLTIIKELAKRKEYPFLIVSDKTRYILKSNYHNGFMNIKEIELSLNHKTKIKNLYHAIRSSNELNNILKLGSFVHTLSWIFKGLLAYEFSLQFLSDDIFLVADSDIGAIEKGFFVGANCKKVKNAIFQHGFFDKRLFPIHAYYHIDWGPYFSQKAFNFGHPLERSVSLGCPRFDVIEELKKKPKDEKFLERYRIKKRPVVLAISGVHAYDLYPKSVESFFESLKRLIDSGISVLIRRHPAEVDKNIYLKFLGVDRLQKCTFVEPEENLYEVLRNSDLMYSYGSATSIEGMLFGIPVLWESEGEGNPFQDMPLLGGGLYVNSETIVDIVKNVGFENNDRKNILEKQENFLSLAMVNRGMATQAVVEYLLGGKR